MTSLSTFMNQKKLGLASFALISFAALEANALAGITGFEDIIKLSVREDGKYNVICADKTVEIGVTLEDLLKDRVCTGTTDDDEEDEEEEDEDPTQIPDMNDIKVEMSAPRGSGCKLEDGKPTAAAQLIKMDNKALALATSYQRLEVNNEGGRNKRKFCSSAIQLNIPEGWQVAPKKVLLTGTADLPASVNGIVSFSVGFMTSEGKKNYRLSGNVKPKSDDTLNGPFEYEGTDIDEAWSECGRTFPLETKTSLRMKGKNAGSVSLVGDASGGFAPTQFIELQWRRCQ